MSATGEATADAMSAVSLPQPVERFLRHLATERRLSALTIKAYRRDLEVLLGTVQGVPLQELGSHHVRRAVAVQHSRGLSGRSLARMLSAWRGLFGYLARDDGWTHDPCAGIHAPKSPKRLPAALSPDAAQRLVEIAGEDVFAVRDRALLELLYSCGLRLAEITSLDWPMIAWAEGTVRVVGKGGTPRIVPIGAAASEALRAWRVQRQALVRGAESAVFVNRTGGRLSRRSIQVRVERAGLRQGMASRMHPHVLRHSFASHVLQSSGDLRAVQEMLGHASISTTQVYTHLDFQHLAKVYDAAHPRARKKPA